MTHAQSVSMLPRKLRGRYDVSPRELRVEYRPRSWFVACFLAFWLLGWTVGCVFLAAEAVRNPSVFTLMFGIPFWSAWVVVVCILVGAVARRQRLVVDDLGLQYEDRAIVRLSERRIPREEFRAFEMVTRREDKSNSAARTGLEVRSLGEPLFVLAGLPDDELRWLARQLSQLVDLPARDTAVEPAVLANSASAAPQTLVLKDEALDPPSDAAWKLTRAFHSLVFVQRGRGSWIATLALLFVTGFWNGIVGVFVLLLWGLGPDDPPRGPDWWIQFFFLIPFELIGLCMLLALVAVAAEPLRRSSWQIDSGQITRRHAWLGIGPRWTYPFQALARIDLVPVEESPEKEAGAGGDGSAWMPMLRTRRYGLSLVDDRQRELCRIEGLTEGEARWMANVIMREWPEWFR